MSRNSCVRSAAIIAATAALAAAALPAHAAQRTFVSTGGNDANACSLVAPCRGFAKAITVTDPGGELVVLDSGGYGSVVVNKNVTILSPAGVYAGMSVFAATDGVTVTPPATRVVLRGLTINGQGGIHGIRVQAGEVHVESTVISNMGAAGILVEGGSTVRISGTVSRSNADGLRVVPAAGTVSVLVRDSEFSANATAGIGVSPNAGGANALVTVERSSLTKNGAGLVVAPGASASATAILTQSVASENAGAGVWSTGSTATAFVRESAITRNGTGLLQSASGILNACGANLLVANTSAIGGAIATANCLDVAAVGANAFVQGGNAFGATATLGTTDARPLEAVANGQRALLVLQRDSADWGPGLVNIVGGFAGNVVARNCPNPLACIAGEQPSGGTIAGGGIPGHVNRVTDHLGFVGGGMGNQAGNNDSDSYDAHAATVGGGYGNTASERYSTVGGGEGNVASAWHSTVGGGQNNTAGGTVSTVGGGIANVASGQFSTVSGGLNNTAGGDYSVAMGRRAKTLGDGSFQFADSNNFDFSSSTVNAFRVRATGGVRFVVDVDGAGATTWSCLLTTGNSWSCASDRNLKQDLEPLDGRAVLERLSAMPVYAWSPKGRNSHVRHYGPMAQDFHAAFGLGDDDKMIGMQDADGVALAAIQGLNAKLEAVIAERDAQARELAELRRSVEALLALGTPPDRHVAARLP